MAKAPHPATRIYRGLLYAYPAQFREEYGQELCLAFEDRRREARSALDMARVWADSLLGILREAPLEHMDMILQDLRYAVRILRKNGRMTLAAIFILALGIGSSTLVFSLANGLMLRPLPYPDPDRLVKVDEFSPKDPNEFDTINYPNYVDMRARTRLLEAIGAYRPGSVGIVGDRGAATIPAARMTSEVFRALAIAPLMGRTLLPEECLPSGTQSAVISYDFWQRHYGSDPQVLGKTLETFDQRYTIVGVMPSGFNFPRRTEVWLPMQRDPSQMARTDQNMEGIARLKPGVSVQQASAELQALLTQIHRENPAANNGFGARATPLRESMTGMYRKAVITLLIAVGCLLLIACINVSNLILVKGAARMREMAVRSALGASRTRLVRQLISESLVLGLSGGALGLVLAYFGTPALLSLVPIDLPVWLDFSLDYRVLAFAMAVSALAGVTFGMLPALATSRVNLAATIKEGGRGGTSARRQKLFRSGLVVAEVALSLTLLVAAGLMIRSFVALRSQDIGYRPEHVLSLSIDYPDRVYPEGPKAQALMDRVRAEAVSLPGVLSGSFTTEAPMDADWTRIYTIEGHPLPLNEMPHVNHFVVAPGYFDTIGIRLLQGRDFVTADYYSPNILIVSQGFAKAHWPGESALGKRVRFGPPKKDEPWHTVVGVVAEVRQHSLKKTENSSVYLPYNAEMTPDVMLIRTAGDPTRLVQGLRARIAAIDSNISISHVTTLDQLLEREAWKDRFFAVLLGAFAAFALLLASAGLYAVLSYTVTLQTHEIGIRMALGAHARSVQAQFLRHGLGLTTAGLAIGTATSFGVMRLLKSQLFETSPWDPATYVSALVALLVVAGVAAFLPAARATRVDPATALRHE